MSHFLLLHKMYFYGIDEDKMNIQLFKTKTQKENLKIEL